jgi:L-methionine (R)-S-oxide reductase
VGNSVLKSDPIAKKLHAAFCRDVTRQELLQIGATLVREAGAPYTSVYMYMLDASGKNLELEAFDGRETPHTNIPIGRGLCGKAITTGADLNIPNVSGSPEYLACNLDTKSELIVLIRRHDEILGQIDIDSDVPDGFNEDEQAALKEVADALASLL